MTQSGRGRPTLFLFALASLGAVAAGAATLAAAGLGPGTWIRNPAAWAVGALLAAGLGAAGRTRVTLGAALLLAPAGLAATFLAEPVDGVHRWIDAGPLHVNVAALLLPTMIVAAAFAGITRSHLALVALGLSAILLALQPDASQATALATAAAVLAMRADGAILHRTLIASALAGVMLAAWSQPDPLEPVAEVEGIFGLAWTAAPVLAVLAGLALAAAAAAPLLARGGGPRETEGAALALCAYFAVTALAPLAGAYPVPLVGLGMSVPVGWWLAIGLLCGGARNEAANG